VNDKQLYNNLEQTTTTLHDTMLQAQTGVTDFQENMEALKHNFLPERVLQEARIRRLRRSGGK
jgi:hypothetical protein